MSDYFLGIDFCIVLLYTIFMPSRNMKPINIWPVAHEHLKKVTEAYKSRGYSSANLTSLASNAILGIKMPNGSGPFPITIEETDPHKELKQP